MVSKSFLRVNRAANRLTDYYKRYYQRYQKVVPQTAPPRNTPLRSIMLTRSDVRWPWHGRKRQSERSTGACKRSCQMTQQNESRLPSTRMRWRMTCVTSSRAMTICSHGLQTLSGSPEVNGSPEGNRGWERNGGPEGE